MLLFPDVDLMLTSEMRSRLPEGTYVNRKVPSVLRDPMVIVTRRGGDTFTRMTDRVRVGVNIYASTEKAAGDLARLARAHLHALADEGITKHCRTSGPAEVASDTNLIRFFFNAEFTVRGTQI